MQELADLDPSMILDLLPDLYDTTLRLYELLMPHEGSPKNQIDNWKALQVPGSQKAKRLRHLEKLFESSRENYGNDLFINVAFILRKLFNTHDPGSGDFRPDAVLQAANIVILVKAFLVIQQDNANTLPLLQRVDDLFPSPFLTTYESTPKQGSSALLQGTFNMALALRAQVAVACLKNYKDETNFNPDYLLAQLFFDPPNHRDMSLNLLEDSMLNGRLRRVAGIDPNIVHIPQEMLSQHEKAIIETVNSIRETFNSDPDTNADEEHVDFDKLANAFNWNSFLTSMVEWGQSRMEEIQKNIDAQNGISHISTSLAQRVQALDTPIELLYVLPGSKSARTTPQHKRSSLLPPGEIVAGKPGKRYVVYPEKLPLVSSANVILLQIFVVPPM